MIAASGRTQPGLKAGKLHFAPYDLSCLRKNAAESETGKLVACRLRSASTRPDDSCTLACFRTRSIWPKYKQAIQIGSKPVLHSMVQAFLGIMEPNWMQEVASGITDPAQFWLNTGHNPNTSRSDLACLLGQHNIARSLWCGSVLLQLISTTRRPYFLFSVRNLCYKKKKLKCPTITPSF